jgi:Rap1a immunity proteins
MTSTDIQQHGCGSWRSGVMRALVLGTAIGLMATPALAQDDKFSANSMLPYCRAALNNQAPIVTSEAIMQGMCIAIVDVIDFMMSNYPPEEQEYRSCPPSDMTLREAVQVVITYIDARPERMNENFKTLAIEAIHAAWPCGTN